jgi:site-specific recombinase XerD
MLAYGLQGLVSEYILSCQAEGKSGRTTRWYEQKLGYAIAYLQASHDISRLDQVGPQEIRRFIQHLQRDVKAGENNPRRPTQDKPLSPQTVAGYVRTLRAFFSWARKEGFLDENPMMHVKTPQVPRLDMPFFTDEEIEQLLSVLKGPTAVRQRNYTMVVLLLDTGLRVSELVHMGMHGLYLAEGYFKVIGKGSKERSVPLGRNSRKALLTYINRYRPTPSLPSADYVFLTQDGDPLRADYVYKVISEACQKVGIEGKRLGPHTCRHTFARSFLMNGGDLLTLQRILGHTSLEVVRLYVNLQTEDLLAQQSKYSPMDGLTARSTRPR